MGEYLFTRQEGAPGSDRPVDEIGPRVFFQMWKIKQDPFEVLRDGDTLWWADQKSREVRWEMRARNVRRDRYSSVAVALEHLRRWFGLLPSDLTAYHEFANPEGWILAFEAEIVGPVSVTLPAASELRLGRNGFRRVGRDEAKDLGLAEPGGSAAVPIASYDDDPGILAFPRTRHIPQQVKDEVFRRDGRVCQECGRTDGPMHLDHIHPWSKGGSNTTENLRVLCAPCNIAKGAAAAEGLTVVPGVPSLVRLARRHNAHLPATPVELSALLAEAANDGNDRDVIEVMWDVFHHVDFNGEIWDAIGDALEDADGPIGVQCGLLDALGILLTEGERDTGIELVEGFLDADNPSVVSRAAAYLALAEEDDDRKRTLAQTGLRSDDVRVQAVAQLELSGLAASDEEWREALLFAIDHGDASISAAAAYNFGVEVADEMLAFEFLERALRSPSLVNARDAANAIAELFADDSELARHYVRRAEELQALLDAGEVDADV